MVKGYPNVNSAIDKLQGLHKLGFHIVPFEIIYKEIITEALIESFKGVAKIGGYPIDGLVAKYDDISYGQSLGMTAHHRRDGLAFKFFDETVVSHLLDIEWTMGRTGVLTPVAIFEPVNFDGSTIERASLHNVSIMEELFGVMGPYKGDEVHVFKANMIIPQIQSVKHINTSKEYKIEYPQVCPVCGGEAYLNTMNSSTFIVCKNPSCEGKLINKLDHFCGKSGLDIKGLSKATLEKLIDWGWVNCFADLFKLKEYEANWKLKPGFGEASVRKLLDAIEEARTNSTHESFISAIGIPMIGKTMVKELIKNGVTTYNQLRNMVDDKFDFSQFNGFGYEKSDSLLRFNYHEADMAYHEMTLVEPSVEEKKENTLEGKSIVITGTLRTFKNRTELQRVIEAAGGKVVGAVSKNTSYLINNDIESTSAKNQTAKRLGVRIITEEDFLKII
jgi:DNA ligase (NAD+)